MGLFFSGQQISKCFTRELLTNIALSLFGKSKDVDEHVCVLMAVVDTGMNRPFWHGYSNSGT